MIESGRVAEATLASLNEKIHPYVLDDCPDLLSVGFRCRREGYTFERQPYSDHPMLRTPDGKKTSLVDTMDIPYFLEEINEMMCPRPTTTM